MELVYMDGKKEPYTLSSIVAECAEVKHRHLKILLNKHREDFESFGKVQFKISPSESGQNVRDYILNEQQATLLITYLRNTEPVKEFKTVTNAKGVEIPKYFKDFKKLVEMDRQLAEYLCMNYELLDSEDLGAFLETVEQGFSWILELIESKDLLYSPQTGKKA